jgi:hypothetical protein
MDRSACPTSAIFDQTVSVLDKPSPKDSQTREQVSCVDTLLCKKYMTYDDTAMKFSGICNDWPTFIRHWCLDAVPAFGQAETIRALNSLEQHWPEELPDVLTGRGLGLFAWPVQLGLTLADSCGCPGFKAVLDRVKIGERSALTELDIAARLQRAGYDARLGVEVAGKTLDIGIPLDGCEVYIEIVTPELSEIDTRADIQVKHFMESLDMPLGTLLRGRFLTFPSEEVANHVRAAIRSSRVGEAHELPGVAAWSIEQASGNSWSVEFSWLGYEDRAQKIFTHEYEHFVGEVPYVLVVNAKAPLLSVEAWGSQFRRRFQPTRYRKVGAAVAYHDFMLPTGSLLSQFCVETNPYARHPVPLEILSFFRHLNQPFPNEPVDVGRKN